MAGQYQVPGFADGTGAAATFSYPYYLAGDGADHLYVTDRNLPVVRRLTISTGEVKTIAGDANSYGFMDGSGTSATFAGPSGIAVDWGLLYVCDASITGAGAGLRSVDLASFEVVTVAGGTTVGTISDGVGTAAKLSACLGMAGDGHGHIYFGDAGVLRMFDTTSHKVTKVVGTAFSSSEQPGALSAATINTVNGLAVLPSGDLLYDDAVESSLFEVRSP